MASPVALERLVGTSDATDMGDRLCTLWIDELYLPGIRLRDGLRANRTAAGLRVFEAEFSPAEITLLEQFHRFLELRLEMLPKRLEAERAFPNGEFWKAISGHAGRILEEIDPEGLELDEITERTTATLWGGSEAQ